MRGGSNKSYDISGFIFKSRKSVFLMLIENKKFFVVWPKHGYFNFLQGVFLCVKIWFF